MTIKLHMQKLSNSWKKGSVKEVTIGFVYCNTIPTVHSEGSYYFDLKL